MPTFAETLTTGRIQADLTDDRGQCRGHARGGRRPVRVQDSQTGRRGLSTGTDKHHRDLPGGEPGS